MLRLTDYGDEIEVYEKMNSESLLVHGEYIKVREGMFNTYIELPNGEEIQLDVDYDDLLKLLDK